MALLYRWLEGSLFLGWLLRIRVQPGWGEGSLIIRVLKWISGLVQDLLRGSWFLSWLVRGNPDVFPYSQERDPGLFGTILGWLWERILKFLWSLGSRVRPLIEGSGLLTRPVIKAGLFI